MSSTSTRSTAAESGFALILAILTLLLLTVLGLTLATTTTTEVQIAANYRYSRQALYNAEAGMQVARYVLARMAAADPTNTAQSALPPYRGGTWSVDAAPAQVQTLPEDYYPHMPLPGVGPGCDRRGGVGYGRVLVDNTGTPYVNVSNWNGAPLMGTYTIWVRRPLLSQTDGTFKDQVENNLVVVTVRGTAPYTDTVLGGLTASSAQFQAERVLEATLQLESAASSPCGNSGMYQYGRDQLGTNFDPCSILTGADFAPGWLDVP